jgi:hypothetical protein
MNVKQAAQNLATDPRAALTVTTATASNSIWTQFADWVPIMLTNIATLVGIVASIAIIHFHIKKSKVSSLQAQRIALEIENLNLEKEIKIQKRLKNHQPCRREEDKT